MNKGTLIEKIAKNSHLSLSQSRAALDVFLKTITQSLKKGEKVKLVDFGTFLISKRAERKGRHPKDGSEIIIAAKKVVRFRPGGALAKRLR